MPWRTGKIVWRVVSERPAGRYPCDTTILVAAASLVQFRVNGKIQYQYIIGLKTYMKPSHLSGVTALLCATVLDKYVYKHCNITLSTVARITTSKPFAAKCLCSLSAPGIPDRAVAESKLPKLRQISAARQQPSVGKATTCSPKAIFHELLQKLVACTQRKFGLLVFDAVKNPTEDLCREQVPSRFT